jgi:hypothetical protein
MNGQHDHDATDETNAPPVENAFGKDVGVAAGQDHLAPDVAEVISHIMDHAERVEEQCALSQRLEESGESKGLVFIKANAHLKIQSLPILDNLVCDIERQVTGSRR